MSEATEICYSECADNHYSDCVPYPEPGVQTYWVAEIGHRYQHSDIVSGSAIVEGLIDAAADTAPEDFSEHYLLDASEEVEKEIQEAVLSILQSNCDDPTWWDVKNPRQVWVFNPYLRLDEDMR